MMTVRCLLPPALLIGHMLSLRFENEDPGISSNLYSLCLRREFKKRKQREPVDGSDSPKSGARWQDCGKTFYMSDLSLGTLATPAPYLHLLTLEFVSLTDLCSSLPTARQCGLANRIPRYYRSLLCAESGLENKYQVRWRWRQLVLLRQPAPRPWDVWLLPAGSLCYVRQGLSLPHLWGSWSLQLERYPSVAVLWSLHLFSWIYPMLPHSVSPPLFKALCAWNKGITRS